MRTQNIAAAVAAMAALSIPTAQAQVDPSVTPPALSQPLNPCPPGVGNNAASNETTGSSTLSDQLSQSKGVICPPAGIDPGISVPPGQNSGDSAARNSRWRSEYPAKMKSVRTRSIRCYIQTP
jgi:hypothetical protein